MNNNDLKAVVPTAELLSEMESLVVLGGDGGIGGTTYNTAACNPNLLITCTYSSSSCPNTSFQCSSTFFTTVCNSTDNCPVTYMYCHGAYCAHCVEGCGN